PNFGLADSGIKKQIIVSSQRSYFDNNVLIGPEYSYQSLYNGEAIDKDIGIFYMIVNN
ncbi:hypothetical protein IBE71_09770, partial [Francisella tularensis]|nr:hypothetical protein [Francisella tularensis]